MRDDELIPIGMGRAPADDDPTRRDFLTLMGFGLSAAALAACRAPVQKAVPLAVAGDDIVPGTARFYATTCAGCASGCSLLVKQRDGRPIKIEGNDASPLFGGGTCASGQATVLSLYDDARHRGPLWQGRPTTWRENDRRVADALAEAERGRRQIVLLTSTVTSPSTLAVIDRWRRRFPGFRHVVYDAVSASALRVATSGASGRAVPHYAFDRARTVVGLDADFLGTWLSPVEFAAQWGRARRSPDGRPLHVQL